MIPRRMAEHELNERLDGQLMVGASRTGRLAGVACGGPRQASADGIGDRRRLARDLHDGVQAELVSLVIRLKLAQEDPVTPDALARTFELLGDHATAALASVREIVLGVYPPTLASSGVIEALRTLAARAWTTVIVSGTVPRSTDEAEVAVYFSCSEAIQNVAKHAGPEARVTVSLKHDHGKLAVRVKDDGRGFDPARVQKGTGLGNIRDRIHGVRGSVELDSHPGHGTILLLSLPWPRRPPNAHGQRLLPETSVISRRQ
jgi:signal transduction histidine kinase